MRIIKATLIITMLTGLLVNADAFKCDVNGVTQYQQTPCNGIMDKKKKITKRDTYSYFHKSKEEILTERIKKFRNRKDKRSHLQKQIDKDKELENRPKSTSYIDQFIKEKRAVDKNFLKRRIVKSNSFKRNMLFSKCKTVSENVLSATGRAYPTTVTQNTNKLYIVKQKTNDGIVTVTCNGYNNTMSVID